MQLDFISEATNLIFLGSNGVGKSTIAQNLAYQAAIQGYSVLFTSAAHMLNDLAAQKAVFTNFLCSVRVKGASGN